MLRKLIAIGSVVLIAGPVLHLRFWSEEASFFHVETR